MTMPYTPSVAKSAEHGFTGNTFNDPGQAAYAALQAIRADVKFFADPVQSEILGLWNAAVSGKQYGQLFNCLAGLAVGQAVRFDPANDTKVLQALSDNATDAKVVAFCIQKPTATTCFIAHFYLATGLAGLTRGNPIYLKDDGTYGAAPGTVRVPVGIAFSAISGLLSFTPRDAASNISLLVPPYFTPEIDLTAVADQTFSVPGSATFWHNSVGLLITQLDGTITTQPTIRFGITGTPQKYLANVLAPGYLSDTSLPGRRVPYNNLLADDGETSLIGGISTGATLGTATKYKGKFYWQGIAI